MKFSKWMAILVVVTLTTTVSSSQEAPKPHPGGHIHKLGPPSKTLTVTIDGKTKQFTMAELEAMPQENVTVFDKKANRDMVWSGPSLTTVLAASGMSFSPETEHDIMHHYVMATGTDGYMAVFSAAELLEQFSGISSIVATKRDGQPLGSIGQFVLFNNQDKIPPRRISNHVTVDVRVAGH